MDIHRLPSVPNEHPDGRNWTVAILPTEVEGEDRVGIVAYGEEDDLPEVTEVSHRFVLYEDEEENGYAIYHSGTLHRHGPGDGECETFKAAEGQAELDDIPEDLFEAFEEMMGLEVHTPGDEPEEAFPLDPRDLVGPGPDTDPGGMYQ